MITPLLDRALIKILDPEHISSGGIMLPENATRKSEEGIVMAVGEGGFDAKGNRIPMEVRTGDTVLFDKYAGMRVKIRTKDYIVLRETDILGIISRAGAKEPAA